MDVESARLRYQASWSAYSLVTTARVVWWRGGAGVECSKRSSTETRDRVTALDPCEFCQSGTARTVVRRGGGGGGGRGASKTWNGGVTKPTGHPTGGVQRGWRILHILLQIAAQQARHLFRVRHRHRPSAPN